MFSIRYNKNYYFFFVYIFYILKVILTTDKLTNFVEFWVQSWIQTKVCKSYNCKTTQDQVKQNSYLSYISNISFNLFFNKLTINLYPTKYKYKSPKKHLIRNAIFNRPLQRCIIVCCCIFLNKAFQVSFLSDFFWNHTLIQNKIIINFYYSVRKIF